MSFVNKFITGSWDVIQTVSDWLSSQSNLSDGATMLTGAVIGAIGIYQGARRYIYPAWMRQRHRWPIQIRALDAHMTWRDVGKSQWQIVIKLEIRPAWGTYTDRKQPQVQKIQLADDPGWNVLTVNGYPFPWTIDKPQITWLIANWSGPKQAYSDGDIIDATPSLVAVYPPHPDAQVRCPKRFWVTAKEEGPPNTALL